MKQLATLNNIGTNVEHFIPEFQCNIEIIGKGCQILLDLIPYFDRHKRR